MKNKSPVILAFMQNAYFPEGTDPRHIKRYIDDQDFHKRVLKESMSGGRLYQAFAELYEQIWWDNVSTHVAHYAGGKGEIDWAHTEGLIKRLKPDLILAIGNLAYDAVHDSIQRGETPYMRCHHPNARHKTLADLCDFAQSVREWVSTWRLSL